MKYSIIFMVFLITVSCGTEPEPEEIREKYLEAVKASQPFSYTNQFMSSNHKKNHALHIQKLVNRKNVSHTTIEKSLIARARASNECVKDLKIISKSKTTNTAIVEYSFKDTCWEKMRNDDPDKYKDLIVINTEKIHFVYEDGWKIDHVSYEPNESDKVRQVINLDSK